MAPDQWHYLALAVANGRMTLYVDGTDAGMPGTPPGVMGGSAAVSCARVEIQQASAAQKPNAAQRWNR